MLQYGWPGTITQSIDDAANNRPFFDPGGMTYPLNSFNTDRMATASRSFRRWS